MGRDNTTERRSAAHTHFNPRAPCGVRLQRYVQCRRRNRFQSTHPVRGATALRLSSPLLCPHFNPRTPCGVRLGIELLNLCDINISIHAPRAGCDLSELRKHIEHHISIHAPRAGCDLSFDTVPSSSSDFNPRTPCGVRRTHPARGSCGCYFNPRTPCGVRLEHCFAHCIGGVISIHAPRAGCDGSATVLISLRFLFQSTHPVRGATSSLFPLRSTST